MPNLDPTMLALLRILQDKGDNQLGKATAFDLGISQSQVSKMRQRARELRLIAKEEAVVLNPKAFGFALAFYEVKFKDLRDHIEAEKLWATWPEVQEIHTLLPHHTTMLKVRLRDNEELHKFKMRLLETAELEEVRAHIAGFTTKETSDLPL